MPNIELWPDVFEIEPIPSELRTLNVLSDELLPIMVNLSQTEQYKKLEKIGAAMSEDNLVPEISDTLMHISSHRNARVIAIRGPEPDDADIGKTPLEYRQPENNKISKTEIRRGLILGIMGVNAYGYTSQQPGNIRNEIIAIDKLKNLNGVSASPKELDLHTEDASYNLIGAQDSSGNILPNNYNASPDWLTLSFLRNPDNIPTFISVPNADNISPETREILSMPYYRNLTNPGQGGTANDADYNSSVIYSIDDSEPYFRINTSNIITIVSAPKKAKEALGEFISHLDDMSFDLPVTPGTIVVIDNLRVMHGRRAYGKNLPKYDGYDRWQQRIVATDDLDRIKPFEVSERIVDPMELIKLAAVRRKNEVE